MKTTCDTTLCNATEPATGIQSCPGPAECLREVTACGGPCEQATQTWSDSFTQAMKQAQVDLLKARILKAWGPVMEQSADAMLELMGTLWQTKIAEERTVAAKADFVNRLRDLWLQDKKK